MKAAPFTTLAPPRPETCWNRGRAVAVLCLLTAFYFMAGVTNRTEAVDTLSFSADAEVFPFWSNPDSRMLLFYRINRLVFRAVDAAGLDLGVYTVLGLLGSLFAAGSVLLLYRLLKTAFGLSEPASVAGALTLAVSYGFLRYANEIEVYAGATFLTLLSLNLLFDHIEERPLRIGRAILLGMMSGLAVAYYQPTAFPLFLAAAVLFIRERNFVPYLAYGAAGVGVYAANIIGSLWIEHGHSPDIAALKALLVARSGEFETPEFGVASFLKAGLAILHDFASLAWLYGVPGVEELMRRLIPNHHYGATEIFFAARNYGPVWIAAATFVATMAWSIYLVVASLREARSRSVDDRIAFVLIWLALAGAANLVLNPGEREVWIVSLPAIAILVAVLVYEPLRALTWQLAAMVALLLLHNLIGGIGIFRSERGDLYESRTSWLREHGERGDWMLTTKESYDRFNRMRILRYPIAKKPDGSLRDPFFNFMFFDGSTAIVQRWTSQPDKEIAPNDMLYALKNTGNRVFVLDTAINPTPRPPRFDRGGVYAKLAAFAEFLKPYATLVDDGPHGKTFEIDKARLPETWPGG